MSLWEEDLINPIFIEKLIERMNKIILSEKDEEAVINVRLQRIRDTK